MPDGDPVLLCRDDGALGQLVEAVTALRRLGPPALVRLIMVDPDGYQVEVTTYDLSSK